jgi:hypothetical protein
MSETPDNPTSTPNAMGTLLIIALNLMVFAGISAAIESVTEPL